MTAFVASFVVAILAVTGLVVDGGHILAARQQADDEAEAAARAGAQALDENSLRQNGSVLIDPAAARAQALDYLAATGHEGTVEVLGDTVRVEVRFERELSLLSMFGIGPTAVSGEGEARGIRGLVTGGS